jgi:hypothetical protein
LETGQLNNISKLHQCRAQEEELHNTGKAKVCFHGLGTTWIKIEKVMQKIQASNEY